MRKNRPTLPDLMTVQFANVQINMGRLFPDLFFFGSFFSKKGKEFFCFLKITVETFSIQKRGSANEMQESFFKVTVKTSSIHWLIFFHPGVNEEEEESSRVQLSLPRSVHT